MAEIDDRLARVGAIVVEDRVLRRVIKRHRRIGGIGLQVPHATSYVLPKARLVPLVEPGEVAVAMELLPERVVVFTQDRGALETATPEAMTHAWRAIFHARVHEAFDAKVASGELTTAAIRERVNRIGQTEFDEIRFVLRQADLLLPPHDDATTYAEFVALYLELVRFAPHTVAQTFPALADARHIDAAIAPDIDVDAVLAASRPPGAPETPAVEAPREADEAEPLPRAVAHVPAAKSAATRARAKGNRGRAAILSIRAGDRDAARDDLAELAARLARAVGTHGGHAAWIDALMPVAEIAASQRVLRFTAGARLLYDLQAACVIAEREVKVVDVMTWALSLGRRPIVRALPATREVRVAKHLRAAATKISKVRVGTAAERERLGAAIHDMVERAEANVRTTLRPRIEAALDEVDLRPANLPERVAQNKVVDELLDHAVTVGRLTIGNLRDTLSHNDLKMHDLRAAELVRGDQLLRADRALSRSLDGVYRRGESYMRFLQKLSSVLFGTSVGRFITLYLLLPVLGAYIPLTGLQHIVGPVSKILWGVEPEIATNARYVSLAVFLFLMLHAAPFRRGVGLAFRYFLRGLRFVLWDVPRAFWRLPIVRRVMEGRAGRWLIKPAIPAAIAVVVIRGRFGWPVAAAVFVVFEVIMNSRFGRLVEEVVADWLVRLGRHFARRIIPGLIRYLLQIFADLVELLDRGIYRIDEWLRFKAGQSAITLVIKGVLGLVWFVLSYVLRLYVNLFIEPSVNPVKHFPVVTVAAKILWPFSKSIIQGVARPLVGLVGVGLASSFGAFTALVLPGFAGFLVWEFKENWKLYKTTRPGTLKEIAIGHHGESMVGFMKLGFHSGTIPKAYAKLRRAAWKGDERAVAKHKEGLHHVEEAVWKFAERELVALLNEAKAFCASDVAVTGVELGSNRVEIEIAADSVARERLTIAFEEQSGWLLGRIPHPGWIDRLEPAQRRIFEIALAGFYKRAGVDLSREQVEHALAAGGTPPAYDVSAEGLVVWPGRGYQTEVIYDLRSQELAPVVRGSPPTAPPPELVGRDVVFGRQPIAWPSWVTTWERIASGGEPAQIFDGPSLLPETTRRGAAAAV